MTAPCCIRRVSGVSASIVPGALLVLLPKCPLCLAAWLTVATGISVSEAVAMWLRGSIMALCIASLTVYAAAHFSGRFRWRKIRTA